jgi:hypothetical protein
MFKGNIQAIGPACSPGSVDRLFSLHKHIFYVEQQSLIHTSAVMSSYSATQNLTAASVMSCAQIPHDIALVLHDIALCVMHVMTRPFNFQQATV